MSETEDVNNIIDAELARKSVSGAAQAPWRMDVMAARCNRHHQPSYAKHPRWPSYRQVRDRVMEHVKAGRIKRLGTGRAGDKFFYLLTDEGIAWFKANWPSTITEVEQRRADGLRKRLERALGEAREQSAQRVAAEELCTTYRVMVARAQDRIAHYESVLREAQNFRVRVAESARVAHDKDPEVYASGYRKGCADTADVFTALAESFRAKLIQKEEIFDEKCRARQQQGA